MKIQVALVEDDKVIRDNYSEILSTGGYRVLSFSNRHEAMQHFTKELPDIVILDVGLNEESNGGFKLCADLRNLSPRLPIIFLTSRDDEMDRISGMRLGADDYITKDISIRYLMVRIETLFHRIETLTKQQAAVREDNSQIFNYGNLTLDRNHLTAYWRSKPVVISLTQFWILNELLNVPGDLKTYNNLMKAAKICVEPNTITSHIKTIRERFKFVDKTFDCIKNERGSGYRWVDSKIILH